MAAAHLNIRLPLNGDSTFYSSTNKWMKNWKRWMEHLSVFRCPYLSQKCHHVNSDPMQTKVGVTEIAQRRRWLRACSIFKMAAFAKLQLHSNFVFAPVIPVSLPLHEKNGRLVHAVHTFPPSPVINGSSHHSAFLFFFLFFVLCSSFRLIIH